MKIAGKKPWYLEYLLIIVGTGLMGTAITSCFDAAGMVTGGFSGIAILVKAWTKGLYGNGIPLWITNLILNVPLFLLATKIRGFAFVRKALMGDISLTIWLAILPSWKLSGDFLLVALYGGLLQGIGIGFVFLGGGTTGGTDLLAAIIQKYLRHYSIAQIMQFIDGAIVVVGMYVFGVERALYAIIAVFLVTKVSDGIIEGLKFSKSVYIITDKPDEVSRMVMEDLDRGITGISAKGMYSGEDKLMLFCVVGKKELVHLKEKIDEIDAKGNLASNKETDTRDTLCICLEAAARGIYFKNIDIEKSDAKKFVITEDGKGLIIPFCALDGLGENVAKEIIKAREDAPFISQEDLQKRGKVNGSSIEKLKALGCLDGLSESNQLSLF